MRRLTLLLAPLLVAPALAGPPAATPVGFTIDESECASGGPRIHFFDGGRVVIEDCGEDCPIVAEGTWRLAGSTLTVQRERELAGVGKDPIMAASRTIFAEYTAVERPSSAVDTYAWEGEDEGCTKIVRHSLPSASSRAVLRAGFEREHPEVSDRELDGRDLAGKTKAELSRMRNEVFASYGHSFKNAEVRAYFAQRRGYVARFVDVGALLTPLEKANIERIRAAEQTAR
jgi:hypothetical protein